MAFLGIRGGIRGGNQVKDEGWGVGGGAEGRERRDSSSSRLLARVSVTTVVHGPAKRK